MIPATVSVRHLTETLCVEFERMQAESNSLRRANAKLLQEMREWMLDPPTTRHVKLLQGRNALLEADNHQLHNDLSGRCEQSQLESGESRQTDDVDPVPAAATEKLQEKSYKVIANVMQKLMRSEKEKLDEDNDHHDEKSSIVTHPYFELVFGVLIVCNALVMAFAAQYDGIDNGHDLEFRGYENDASDTWPGARLVFIGLDYFFGIVFTVELVVKLVVLRLDFRKTWWNCFDAVVVITWFVQLWVPIMLNPLTLRLLRIARLVRLLKLLRKLEAFDSLRVLLGSLAACGPVFIWSVMVLFLFQIVVGLTLNSFLMDFVSDSNNPLEARLSVFSYFGTFSRSILTMWELTLGNYAGICRTLVDDVSELYGFVVIAYKVVVGFAMIRVISGVFLHETFKTAASDDELMVVQKKRAQQKHGRKMKRLMMEADASNDGYLEREELKKVLARPDVATWLAAQDLDVDDVDLLFDLLDNGDGHISALELTAGVSRLKGAAKSIDMLGLLHMSSVISREIREIKEKMHSLQTGSEHPSMGASTPTYEVHRYGNVSEAPKKKPEAM